ncbi:hypothetical protein B0H17DRAFT_1081272 [Mycena rosella]|uniref:Protein kinase domain-containing protein n=1 Tax=Mycena rosella TaxID=1033263 RepID=A0AAD7D280_MYCRO|nr:hypothetical protein B0H17DRAFT_1081272 [Mycena rosella]
MTVALYEGENAEEEWREAISIFTRIRHPNLVQIFGATGACGARAIVFHDDLMPLEDFVDRHRHSHFAVVYIYDYCIAEFEDADDHVMRIFEIPLLDAASAFFIRRSTARFCVDLRPHSAWDSVPCVTSFTPSYMDSTSRRINMISPDAPDLETMFISSSTLDRYHQICSFNLRHRRDFLCAPRTVVSLGEIRYASPTSPLEDPAPVAFIPGPQVQVMTVFWSTSGSFMTIGDMDDEPMRHAWTRYMYKSRRFSSDLDVQWCAMAGATFHREFWLAQANYCFRHLQIASNYDDYVFVDRLTFRLVVSAAPKDPPQGYLFLWIGADLPEGTSTFSIPDYPAYWSLDATGAERLTTEEASELGFPGIKFTIQASGSSWDADVYVGLRKFHGAKGFDPYSQDVARHLDYPLYQLSGGLGVPLAHGELNTLPPFKLLMSTQRATKAPVRRMTRHILQSTFLLLNSRRLTMSSRRGPRDAGKC